MEESEFIGATTASDVLGVSVSQLHRWAVRRIGGEEIGPPVYDFRGVRRWRRADVIAWAESRRH